MADKEYTLTLTFKATEMQVVGKVLHGGWSSDEQNISQAFRFISE